ncbi:MAG: DUF3237 domain-containing protein [Chloroflexi bacterium]|nr:DUF3237 domain-containing protein [Chloroflexota bacterium]
MNADIPTQPDRLHYRLEYFYQLSIGFAGLDAVGPTAEGLLLVTSFEDGKVEGPKLKGRVSAISGDWFRILRDGLSRIEGRATIETEDQALIYLEAHGLADLGEGAFPKALAGDLPEQVKLRLSLHIESYHPDYLWHNRAFCIGIGEADLSAHTLKIDVYGLS